ncbi:MAG: cell division protein FtsW [Kiritimatiellia bacterium]|jgi:cell division protein FtsW
MEKSARTLIAIALVLSFTGIMILASASRAIGELHHNSPYFFLIRQGVFAVVGLVAAFAVSRLNYQCWSGKVAFLLGFVSVGLLIITLAVGKEINGSQRWIDLGFFNLQASEIAKLTSIILVASWMAHMQRKASSFLKGLMLPSAMLGTLAVLILLEPDYGTTLLVVTVGFIIMLMAGSKIGYIAIASSLGLVSFTYLVMMNEVRMRRIIAFLNPEKYAEKEAYQLISAIHAFVMGRTGGAGYGNGMQKEHSMPEAHTDFIFAVLGEDGGLRATLFVLLLFAGLFACGLRISLKAHDQFGKLLGLGITFMITLQALLNMGVVTGCLPTKGLALPFMSYGGSSLIMTAVMIGILVNIAHQNADEALAVKAIPIKERSHWF